MDLLLLGSESRKTHLKPRQNLSKDKYDMEDVDEFFEDDDDDGMKVDLKKDEKESSTPEKFQDYNNVARKINFTDAEAALFHLSPISLTSKQTNKKKSKKSPLRSPLQDNKNNQMKDKIDNDSVLEDPGYDFGNDMYEVQSFENQDFNDVEFPHNEIRSPVKSSSKDETVVPKRKRGRPPKKTKISLPKTNPVSLFTKDMALGNTGRKKRAPHIYEEEEEDKKDTQESQDIQDEKYNNDLDEEDISEYSLNADDNGHVFSPTYVQGLKPHDRKQIIKPSPLPSPPPDGLRRSRRTRIAPLAFWRNERIVYTRAHESGQDPDTTLYNDIKNIPLQEIKEVVHIPELKVKSNSGKKRTRLRSRNIPKRKVKEIYDYESDPEISGSEWYSSKSLSLDVFEDPEKEIKINRTVAWAPDGGDFQSTSTADDDPSSIENFKVATLFNHNKDFTASGLLEFPYEGFKSLRNSGDCIFSFHVVNGLIEVTINNDKFVVTRGCSFEVPNANIYGFKNLGQNSARLFFVQTRIPTLDKEDW